MKTNKLKACILFIGIISFLVTGCYKEEHFDFPGPFPEEQKVADSLPFPFDANRLAGEWLIKDGVPDDKKVLLKGYTDYVPKGDITSWTRKPGAVEVFPHRNFYPLSNADHFDGENDPNSYQKNFIFSKYFIPIGKGKTFYMYAKMTFGTLNATAAGIPLGINTESGEQLTFGLDGGNSGQPTFFVDYFGTTVNVNPNDGWPAINEVLNPGVPFELEIVIADGKFYIKINNTLVFQFNMLPGETFYFTPQIRPWRNFIKVHDFYIESNDMYTLDYAMHEYEKGYNKIQAPALAKANNGDLLLFAEGRTTPASGEERVAQNLQPVGNTDIIMKRSTDNAGTWSDQITVIAGQGDNSTYCFPQVVSLESGKIILHYSKIGGSFSGTGYDYVYDSSTQKIFQIESTDNGQTWSSPVDITTSLKTGTTYIQGGAGRGIELKSTTYNNRLVMPISYSNNTMKVAYSDNGGQTWSLSTQVGTTNLKYPSVVELTDGKVMLIAGHTSANPKNRRAYYSTTGSQTWGGITNLSTTAKSGDFGHLYAGIALKGKDGEVIVVTPTERDKDERSKRLDSYPTTPVAYKSTDNGANFTSMGPLHTKTTYNGYKLPYGFMDAVVLNDGSVVIAGESGVESPTEGIVIYKK